MSIPGSAQISPRILSACERLETAFDRLNEAVKTQVDKIDPEEYETVKSQVEGLKQDNLALSEALDAYSDTDYDSKFEELNEKIETLKSENDDLSTRNQNLKDTNAEFSERLGKLIGNVQQILEDD